MNRTERAAGAAVPLAVGGAVAAAALIVPVTAGPAGRDGGDREIAGPDGRQDRADRGTLLTFPVPVTPSPSASALPGAPAAGPVAGQDGGSSGADGASAGTAGGAASGGGTSSGAGGAGSSGDGSGSASATTQPSQPTAEPEPEPEAEPSDGTPPVPLPTLPTQVPLPSVTVSLPGL